MAKMLDVAKLADVSVATVSRTLRQPETVKEKTRAKVFKAIEQLNYQPNILARQFRTSKTKTILVVVPDISNPFFSKVLRGIENVAVEYGYQVLLGDTDNSIGRERSYLDILSQKQADGMILLTARMRKELIESVAEQYPVVLACEYFEGSSIPTVSIDNISSARKITEHLIGLGHSRIAHISGPMNVILSKDRMKGYYQAIAQNEFEMEPLLVQEGQFTFESGYNQMLKLLALESPPTAVFAANDEMAVGAIKAAKVNGLRVPEDLAVAGFDNVQIASIFEPGITTVAQPMYEIGNKAMEILLKLIHHEALKKRQYVFNDTLIKRESSGFQLKRAAGPIHK